MFKQQLSETIFKKKYCINEGDTSIETVFKGIAKEISSVEKTDKDKKYWEEQFYKQMIEGKFIPAGRIMANARPDSKIKNYNNCFLIDIEDSMEGIYSALKDDAMIQKQGGGVGFNLSKLRPEGAVISKGGDSSGPLSFLRVFNESARTIHTAGCLPENSKIFCIDSIKNIQDVKIGDKVLTSSGYEKVTETFDNGIKSTIIIKTQNGEFECTKEHKMPVLTGINEYTWKRAGDLTTQDKIVFISTGIDGYITTLPKSNYTKSKNSKKITIPNLTPDIAWFFGILFADGYVTVDDINNKGTVSITVGSNEFNMAHKILNCYNSFGLQGSIKEGDGACYNVNVFSYNFAKYLSQFKQPKTALTIPEFILNGTRDIRSAFIAGLFDGDGSCKSRPIRACVTIYKEFADSIFTCLASLGINANISIEKSTQKNWHNKYVINIARTKAVSNWLTQIAKYSLKFINTRKNLFIGKSKHDNTYPMSFYKNSSIYKYSKLMSTNSKQISVSTIERITNTQMNIIPTDIISISSGRTVHVYDLEVANKHELVCNGFLTHNSRRGAHIAVLDVTHPDIEKFITCKRGDQNKEYTQFNLSIGITDAFIKAVKEDADWDLVFDGKVYKTVKAKYLYELITKNAFTFAEPGILNIDTINKESNVWYIGEIKATNPCVIGSTLILTDEGNIPIKDLVGKEVNIWNGFEWSKVIPKKTGENQPLMKIEFSSGQELICTPYHKFILDGNTRVEAKDLKIGDKLAKCNYPVIEGTKELTDQEAYLQGFYSGDGFFNNDSKAPNIYFYKPKEMCMKRCGYTPIEITNTKVCRSAHVHNIDKNFVPDATYTIKTRLSWLAGILDSDGCTNGSDGDNIGSYAISSVNKKFLLDIQSMLQTLGCYSRVTLEHKAQKRIMPDGHGGQKEYQCQASYRLNISKYYIVNILYKRGLKLERLKTIEISTFSPRIHNITITNIEHLNYNEDVYCVNEPKNHSVIFNGILTGNCGEITLLPYESCNLSSIKLSTFVINAFSENACIDWNTLKDTIKVVVKFLDNNLDASSYPLKKIENTVKSLRRVGMGFTAYADMLIKLGLSYGSKEALEFTEKLAAFIRDTAYEESINLASIYGAFPKFDADKFLESGFCKRLPENIRKDIKKFGIRNASLLTCPPTGTTSLSVGNNCSSGLEPVFSFEQTRKVRTGNGDETKNETTYSEVYLDYLNYGKEKGWDKIGFPKWFKTTASITPKEHIDTQAVWQKYLDNSISKTCNLPMEFTYEEYKDLFIYAYDKGCKGFTTFWEGGALAPILSDAKKQVSTSPCSEIVEHCAPKRPQDILCDIHQIIVDHKPVLVLIGKLKDKIYEVFFDYNFTENGDKKIDVMKAKEGIVRKVKSNHYSLIIKTDEGKELVIIDNIADTFDESAGVIARLISGMLRYGTPLQIVLNQLQKTKNFNSFTKIVARVLKKYIKDGEKVKSGQSICPECGNQLVFESGCIVCKNCGFSKCS